MNLMSGLGCAAWFGHAQHSGCSITASHEGIKCFFHILAASDSVLSWTPISLSKLCALILNPQSCCWLVPVFQACCFGNAGHGHCLSSTSSKGASVFKAVLFLSRICGDFSIRT